MDKLESITERLAKEGYFAHLYRRKKEWECFLVCGVDVMSGEKIRPRGTGITALESLYAAVADRDARKNLE